MEDKEAPRGSYHLELCQHRFEVLPDELTVYIHQVSIFSFSMI